MSRAWRLDGVGLDTLRLETRGVPEPGPGEVRLRVTAAAINHRDLGILAGFYPSPPGVIPFSDGAGVIDAVGADVQGWAAGDVVIANFYPHWESGPANAANHSVSLGCEIDGMLAEHAIVPAAALVAAPRTLSAMAAATLPCAGLTAWSALFTEGRLRGGETVVIQGTGGVAVFALQLARMAGARAIVLSGDPAKAARARALGADQVIDYRRTPQWAAAVLDATDGQGADLIVELGGQDTLPQSLECVKVGGRISIIGVLSGLVAALPIPPILFRHIHLTGITVGHRADLAALVHAIDANAIEPVIDGTFDLADARAAYAALPAGRHFGKLVVTMAA
ncbi:MAG: NAD(P)-dependent alcohol dehydrogenase [Sphingomonadales bacterium]|nr:NAD(P)-dependent alcohol dehydrogenase [Sphingomonadales bacterium]